MSGEKLRDLDLPPVDREYGYYAVKEAVMRGSQNKHRLVEALGVR